MDTKIEKGNICMWHSICLCLPATTQSEQQRFLAMFGSATHNPARERERMDLGLSFLYLLSPAEALTVLEERLDLVVRSQELLIRPSTRITAPSDMRELISDHIRILLTAEHIWLKHAITQLQRQYRQLA